MRHFKRLNVVIAIVSNSWDDSLDTAKEVFWKSRVELLFQYRRFKLPYADLLFGFVDNKVFTLPDDPSFVTMAFLLTANLFWLLLGFPTLGFLWPEKFRRDILSAGIADLK